MPVDPDLRSLEIDIPAQPEALVKLSLLLAEDDINLQAASTLIESDMALAAAVLKAVNSSLYGLKGRVQSVQQAVTYLGMREVAAITFEMGLRAAFPPAPELDPLWERASRRGLIMGRMAQQLGVDAWAAHSAGLFEECGKAVLLRHSLEHYRSMLRAATTDTELVQLEHVGFGVSHDALGSALCESWGLGPAAVASVRHHVGIQAGEDLPMSVPRRGVAALSAVAHALLAAPQTLPDVVARVAPQVPLDEALVLRAAQKVSQQLEAA
ncbi:HDOD domain-containing protein [Ideonella sp. BN130291]|uniref:HDOD domain-containing protein n=1 Tax=Ideonella sp. BN130291 TaxID=3112940 RepID=UPI002E2637B1|nr:HDOD domain-containing protein [Ideonella sp. BN130291]